MLLPCIPLYHDRGLTTPRYYAKDAALVLGVHTQAVGAVLRPPEGGDPFIEKGIIRRGTDRDSPWLIHPEREHTSFCSVMIEHGERVRIECTAEPMPLVKCVGDGPRCNQASTIWNLNPTGTVRIVFEGLKYLLTNYRGEVCLEQLEEWEDSRYRSTIPARAKRPFGLGIAAAIKRFPQPQH